jgi:hypothetical protein
MSFTSTMRALFMIFLLFTLFTVGGVLLTVILVHVEPMLLPTFTSIHMLEEYLKWRSWLAQVWVYLAYSLSVVMSYILLLGGIRIASNIWTSYRGGR